MQRYYLKICPTMVITNWQVTCAGKRVVCRVTVTAGLLALVALSFLSCSRQPKPMNLLLITVDTLRPDRLGCYGHSRPTSPTIDALALEGVVFDNCYSAAGWTLPAVATILTGRYPRDHGATDFHWSMNPELATLAGILRRNGYDTRGYVSHVILKPLYGIADGFDTYDFSVLDVGHPHDVSTATPLTDLVVRELSQVEEPFFIWVHYFDPHFEYLSHSKWRQWGTGEEDRYDQEIAHTDSQIGRLLRGFDGKGWLDNTAIVFTSDHGEEFGEHGAKLHYTLYEEVLRVPLVIKAPLLAPARSEDLVEQIDFLPTLLSLLGISAGENVVLPGRDILSRTPSLTPESPPAAFFERDRPPPYNQRGVIEGDYKLIVVEETDIENIPPASRGTHVPITHIHPGVYLYNLAEDPEEQHNLYSASDPRSKELLVKLARHFSGDASPVHEVEIDRSLREKLRSLGYIR